VAGVGGAPGKGGNSGCNLFTTANVKIAWSGRAAGWNSDGMLFPERWVALEALWDSEPAVGNWRTKLRTHPRRWEAMTPWPFSWLFTLWLRPEFVFVLTKRRRGVMDMARAVRFGFAIYRFNGKFSVALLTKKKAIRFGPPSPYAHPKRGGGEEAFFMVVRP
jgi:hypothetical protein